MPPQVIPVNYLRWDVIYRGPEDDWGAQDVESPHVRIVDMHPVDRGGGVVIMGELLNEDVVPAFVTVKATLLAKNGSAIATEDSFDKISHVLLPKQVTPFLIDFPNVRLSQVDSVRMEPSSSLVAASADPVIGIEDQQLNPAPDPSLSGELINQSGAGRQCGARARHVLRQSAASWSGLRTNTSTALCCPKRRSRLRFLFRRTWPRKVSSERAVTSIQFRAASNEIQIHISARWTARRCDGIGFSQTGALHLPKTIEAGSAFSIQSDGSGNAVLYIVGLGQVLRRNVQLGETTSFAPGDLHNAGHYLVFLVGGSSTETARSMSQPHINLRP